MTQRANPKTGCLTTVVRRLLCSGSQQTHPSDNILDSDETLQLLIPYEEIEEPKKEIKTETETQNDDVSLQAPLPPPPPPPPNVVAKLMGLDHPAPGSKRFRYFDDTGSAVARSKSVNFMDYILRGHDDEEEEEDEKDGNRQCRRVKASVSFREIVPTSARWSSNNQQKKHDFLLSYLDKLDEKRELVGSSSFSRSRRFEKVVVEDSKKPTLPPPAKKKENEKVAKKFKDEPRKVAKKKKSENRSDVNGAKKVRWFLSPSKSKSSEKTALLGESKNLRADEFVGKESESPENKSNASPVSVLDRDLYDYLILDDDYYFSGGDSESASELSTTKQVETTTKSSCSSSPATPKTSTKKETGNDSEETEFITKLMNMLSDLSEEDMKSSTWVSASSSTKTVDFTQVEDFCVEFGQEILDLVIDQLVDELCI
ncbi:PREDICTED: uncharacterized protein LOC104708987 [Camelina sativa]|uniref:Uncharacterized protein LOC104708987 n=1 Tax=Camelina sativa TaxID=90675 RepID=A0ABM0TC10_CAMSA|nr:PREDICTED: uncharacterized protein LOC104708987 [Camelina sativa]